MKENHNKSRDAIDLMVDFGKACVWHMKPEQLFECTSGIVKRVIGHQSFIIFLKNRENPEFELIPQFCVSPFAERFADFPIKISEGLPGWVARTQKPLLLEETRDSRIPNIIEEERSAIFIPLMMDEVPIGVLYIGASEPHFYDEEDFQVLKAVTYMAAMALRKEEMYERISSLETTDCLTNLLNHSHFQQRLGEICANYESTRKPFSLLMIETDHFSQYNDRLGHREGDKVLKEIAALISSYTRDSDLLCRYGGDTFAVILVDTDRDNSAKTAERIREAFHYRFHTYPVKLTASIGVASFPENATNRIELVAEADIAVYKSKKQGRNRVTLAPPHSESLPGSPTTPPDHPPEYPFDSLVNPKRRPPVISYGQAQDPPVTPET